MSDFKKFKGLFKDHFETINNNNLFLTDVDKQEMWETYLNSFPDGTNEIVNERREYDCNCCKQFIRQYGNIVTIKDNELISLWDIPNVEFPFNIVCDKMSKYIKSAKIKNIFLTDNKHAGNNITRSLDENHNIKYWEHLYLIIPKEYIVKIHVIDSSKATALANKDVFKRSMEELTLDAGETVLDLIEQGSLYRGEEHKNTIKLFIKYKKEYNKLNNKYKDNWCWLNSKQNSIARIRNTAIGTLLIDISNGIDLDTSVTKFEHVVAPTNYKRPKAIYTKKMIKQAEDKIKELNLESSLQRKCATLEDITINNVLFVNRDAKKKMLGESVLDVLKDDISDNIKNLSKVEEVSIDNFVTNVLPNVSDMELFMENRHIGNLMTLIAPQDKDSTRILKWDNNFSWSYNGDVTDSIKQNVKNAGGNVDGVLRFSIQWNDNGNNNNDFDAHCLEPNGNLIYYANKINHNTSGFLDVDIIHPKRNVAVENIAWTDINKMKDGVYKFLVHNFTHRGGVSGFSAQIEYNGEIYNYSYNKELRHNEKILVAEIDFNKKTGIKFIKSLDSNVTSKNVWNINTHKFAKVSTFMFSPNYWDEQMGKGNKHYFFFLEGCKNENNPRGFYNEFLRTELTEHRKVFEALSSKMKVENSDNQLSGLGFSSTIKNDIIVKINGKFKRIIKIKF